MSQEEQTSVDGFGEVLSTLSPVTAERVQRHVSRGVVTEGETPPPRWYLVVVPFDELPEVLEFESIGDLCEELRKHLGQLTQCYPIFGMLGQLSEGQFPHFVHPDGRAFPLYDTEQTLPVNPDYFLGNREELAVLTGEDVSEDEEDDDDQQPPDQAEDTDDEYVAGEEPEADPDDFENAVSPQWEPVPVETTAAELVERAQAAANEDIPESEPD